MGALHSSSGPAQSDLGDVLQALEPEDRDRLVRLLGSDFDWVALTEVDETIRSEILESVSNEQITEVLRELDPDDAVEIVATLDDEDREEVLAGLPFAERIAWRGASLPDESPSGDTNSRRARRLTVGQHRFPARGSPPTSSRLYFIVRSSASSARCRSIGLFAQASDQDRDILAGKHWCGNRRPGVRRPSVRGYNLLSVGVVANPPALGSSP